MLAKLGTLIDKQKAIALAKNPKATRDELHAAGIWVDKDACRVFVCDMDERRLLNLARFLVKLAHREAQAALDFYISDPGPNGEMAQDAFDHELMYLSENQGEAAIGMLCEMPIYPHVAKALAEKKLLKDIEKLTGFDFTTEAEKEWPY